MFELCARPGVRRGLSFARERDLDAIGVTCEGNAQRKVAGVLLKNFQARSCDRSLQLLRGVAFEPGIFRKEFRNTARTRCKTGIGVELQANRFRLSRH